MTDPLRDALRECEAYFEEGDDDEWCGDEERRLLVAVQEALRSPRIASDEMVERVARALAKADGKDPDAPAWVRYPGGEAIGLCWRDQYTPNAQAALAAMEPSK